MARKNIASSGRVIFELSQVMSRKLRSILVSLITDDKTCVDLSHTLHFPRLHLPGERGEAARPVPPLTRGSIYSTARLTFMDICTCT